MYTLLLQPFVTIRGASTITSVTQGETGWLDMTGFEDVVMWLDARSVTLGGATNISINYETSPCKENATFVALNGGTPVNLTAGSITTSVYLKDSAANPLARWLRWTLLPTGGSLSGVWDATFRIWVAGNSPGSKNRAAAAQTQVANAVANGTPPAAAASRAAYGGGTPATRVGTPFTRSGSSVVMNPPTRVLNPAAGARTLPVQLAPGAIPTQRWQGIP